MGRKVRHYKSKAFYEEMLDNYFKEHGDEVIAFTVKELGFDSLEALRDFEYGGYVGGFGFDCGWVKLVPRNHEMYHEWELDNGKYRADIFVREPYRTQSTTIQRVQVQKALNDLNLNDVFSARTVLD